MGINFSNGSLTSQSTFLHFDGVINTYAYVPAFVATNPTVGGGTVSTAAGNIAWTYIYTNAVSWDGTYVTVLYDGFYYSHCKIMLNAASPNNRYVRMQKNDSASWELRVYSSPQGNMYEQMSGGTCFYMNAGDTLRVYNANAEIYGSSYGRWTVLRVA